MRPPKLAFIGSSVLVVATLACGGSGDGTAPGAVASASTPNLCAHPVMTKGDISWFQNDCIAGHSLVDAVDPSLLDLTGLPAPYRSRVQRCFDLKETQRLCRQGGEIHSCIYGFEIGCERLVSPMGSAFPAIRSRCSDLTKRGLGYPDRTPVAQRLDGCTAVTPQDVRVVSCRFLGQQVDVEKRYCDRLTECVEPALARRYPREAASTFGFPSGRYTIKADLSCSDRSASWSNHNVAQGCRAIDFNVTTNGGNLRADTRWLPEADIPPEFVAVMEGCGIVWGGRFNGAEQIWNGCDPMHFEYDPACLE